MLLPMLMFSNVCVVNVDFDFDVDVAACADAENGGAAVAPTAVVDLVFSDAVVCVFSHLALICKS